MARMIPSEFDHANESYGERQVFFALKEHLPHDYTVFHAFRWNKRTAYGRVTWGEADFTVFHPEYGILVIEVKSGGIALENGQWWYERSDNKYRFPMNDPLEQANRTKYRLMELIEEVLPQHEACWIETAVWFPSISDRRIMDRMPNTYHPEITLMDRALENPKQAIDNALRFYNSAKRTSLTSAASKKILAALSPAFRAVPGLQAVFAEQEEKFLRLTAEQNGLLDYLDEQPSAVIQGSAGTGKTLLACEKARRLSQDGKVLFLCFNRFLVEELRKKIQSENIDVFNLYSLTHDHLQMTTLPTDEEVLDFLNNYDVRGDWEFKHIVVDEGQDFKDEQLDLLAAIAKMNAGAFYVFYDKNQLVHRTDLPTWVSEAECRLVLRRNCRNTHKIATTAGRPVNVEPVLWDRLPEGQSPVLHLAADPDALLRKLGSIVANYVHEKIPLDQIAVLTLKTEERSILSGVKKIGRWPLVSQRDEPGLLFTTARKFKGLEAAVIIAVDLDAATFDREVSRNLFYVATSRAKNFLDLVAVLDDRQKQQLADALVGETGVRNPVARIASALKVQVKAG